MGEIRKFRLVHPKRTCTKVYTSYSRYKDDLAADFNGRCGYTDCPDYFFGGKRTFHIDHFKPKVHFKELENDYANLVYSCSYVNIKKSKSTVEILDPCEHDFNEHFYRDEYGNIIPHPTSPVACEMSRIMGLQLSRYGIVWMLENLERLKQAVYEFCEGGNEFADCDPGALILHAKLCCAYDQYMRYLRLEL